jgi:general secretion pathway protein D
VPGTPPATGAAPVPGAPAPGARAAQPPAAEAGAVPVSERCQPLQGRFLLAFNRADIVDVLEQASRWTCRNFAYTEDVARGKITLLSKSPVTAEEAYAAFLSALASNNIALFQSGRYWKLVRIADAKKAPIPMITEPGGAVPAREQSVTKVIRLRHADPDMLRGLLGNYTSPQGADIQSVPPDLLIITDLGLNILRIEKLLEAIDRPGGSDLIRIIQVKHATARDLAEKINQIFQSAPAAPGRPARRPVIAGVGGQPGQPVQVPVAEGGTEMSISKVLADERTNKLVVIADEKSFQRIQELVSQLDVPTAGDGQIHVVYMRNANAEDLAQTLSALASGSAAVRTRAAGAPAPGAAPLPAGPAGAASATLFSGEVKVTADKVSNALLIMANGSDFVTMQRLIEKLDRPRRQVFIEAVILEVNLTDENQFGVSMHTVLPVNTPSGKGYIPLGSETGRLNSLSPGSLLSLGGFLTGLQGPTPASLQAILPAGIPSLSVLIQALQTSSDVNVLSTPHLLASDNEDAEITVGQNVPFQAGYAPGNLASALTGTATTSGTTATTSAAVGSLLGLGGLSSLYAPIQRQNVELRLKVKPQINEGDTVTLQLDEQTEEIASKDPTLGPTTAKRSVKTKVTVKDQTTIIIGGLIQDRTITGVHKTPLLGDIPVLGWLFRDQTTTKTKTNLLLFLTPYIIRDQSDYRRILDRKRREQREFIEEFYGPVPAYKVVVDYERKAGPYARMRRDVETETLKFENGGPGAPGEGAIGPDARRRGGEPPRAPDKSPAPVELPRRSAPVEPAPGPPPGAQEPPVPAEPAGTPDASPQPDDRG